MTTTNTITEQLAAAIAARKGSLEELRGRIADILDPIPVGVHLQCGPHQVRIIRVVAGASQWANREWDATIKGWGAQIVASGALVCSVLGDRIFFGNNLHARKTGPHSTDRDELSFAAGAVTREIARALPAAIEAYMAECAAETAANTATLA